MNSLSKVVMRADSGRGNLKVVNEEAGDTQVENLSAFNPSTFFGALVWFVAAAIAMLVILDWGGPLGLLPWLLLFGVLCRMPQSPASTAE